MEVKMPTKDKTRIAEETCYAIIYWDIHRLTKAFDEEKAEYAAEKAIRWLTEHCSIKESLNIINAHFLFKSKFWKSLDEKVST
jgi:hypothetical protein